MMRNGQNDYILVFLIENHNENTLYIAFSYNSAIFSSLSYEKMIRMSQDRCFTVGLHVIEILTMRKLQL